MLNEGLGVFILSPFQAVPSDYSGFKEKMASIFALYGDDLNLASVGVGVKGDLKWILAILVVRVIWAKYLY